MQLLDRATACWDAVTNGHIFTDLSREASDARCEVLSEVSVGLHSNASSKEDWFAEVVRPQFGR